MTKEQIYNAVCDMAEDAGISPDELINALLNENEAIFEKSLGELSDSALSLVKAARTERADARQMRRDAEKDGELAESVKQFRTLFPNVEAEAIPQSVWGDMEKGIPLAYAYAFFVLNGESNGSYADEINERNSRTALPAVAEGTEDGELSMEEVGNMSAASVKKNFPRILRSISKWKLQ